MYSREGEPGAAPLSYSAITLPPEKIYTVAVLPETLSNVSRTSGAAPGAVTAGLGHVAREAAGLEGATAAQASHGRSGELRARPVARADRVHARRRGASRQQRFRTGDEARGAESQEFLVRGQPARRKNRGHSGQPGLELPAA